MCFPYIFHVKIWFSSNKFFSLFCSFIRRKEKRKVLLSRTRGRKCHVLKFYFVVLDGVDRRYVNAQREVDEKGYSRRKEKERWIGKSRRTTRDVCFMEDTIEQASGLANLTEDILLRACSFRLFTKIKYWSFDSKEHMSVIWVSENGRKRECHIELRLSKRLFFK